MKPVRSLAKLSIRRLENKTEYATKEFVDESLRTFEAKYSLPVKDAINYLRQGRVDSISLNKETPYANFHATRFKERILVSIREASKDIELELQAPKLLEDTPLDSD
jgi:hypothetical protein